MLALDSEWILEQYPIHQRSGPEFGHLFQSCCQADFLLAGASSEAELFALLNGSDQLEIIPRDVGAFIYERRTGDKVGGSHMRALRVPGANVDILPDWMIKEGTLHSKVEHQRHERVSDKRKPGPKGRGKAKGDKGTGKQKGGAAPKGGAPLLKTDQ